MDLNIFAVAAVAIFVVRAEPLLKVYFDNSLYTGRAPTTVTPFLLAVHVGGGGDAGAGRSLKTEDYSYHADAPV
jgi:hypothetical protein